MIREKIKMHIDTILEEMNLQVGKNYTVEIPKNQDHGDYSTNVALVSSKLNKMKPRDLAEKIAAVLSKKRDYKSVDIAGPGFINFTMSNMVYHQALKQIHTENQEFGKSDFGKGKKVLLEFVSANPTGPLNVVSARAAAFGDSLHRIMKHVGFDSKREFYVNDAGNQVNILAESIELRYRELLGENIGEFPVEAYHGEYVIHMAEVLKAKEGSKLVHMSEKDRLEKIKVFALDLLNEMQINSLERFNVEFDNWFSEKGLREEGLVEGVLSYMAEAHCTYEQDEAIWFSSTKFGDEKDRVLMKSDGSITYFVPDVAYHLTKYERGYDIMIDVLGPDHHGYVPRLMAALEALELDKSKLEIIFLQQVNIFEEGEKVKMSKRLGTIYTMDELINETGKDAARYFFLDRKPSAHLSFNIDLAKKQSSENPVYYCQYAHARISSILKKANQNKFDLKAFDTKELKKLKAEEELNLIKKMIQFPQTIVEVAEHREPHRLATYVLELAGMFHKYYAKHQVITPRYKTVSLARMYLVKSIQNVIKLSLNLMGISAPDSMSKTDKKVKTVKKTFKQQIEQSKTVRNTYTESSDDEPKARHKPKPEIEDIKKAALEIKEKTLKVKKAASAKAAAEKASKKASKKKKETTKKQTKKKTAAKRKTTGKKAATRKTTTKSNGEKKAAQKSTEKDTDQKPPKKVRAKRQTRRLRTIKK